MPRRRAISTGRTPSAFSALTSAARARAVGLRPLYFPSAFARATFLPGRSARYQRTALVLRSKRYFGSGIDIGIPDMA
jgi:hypothetical protein